jgi:hypothetical protein
LILGARSDTLVQSEVLEELADLSFTHFGRMAFAVKKNKFSSPMSRTTMADQNR